MAKLQITAFLILAGAMSVYCAVSYVPECHFYPDTNTQLMKLTVRTDRSFHSIAVRDPSGKKDDSKCVTTGATTTGTYVLALHVNTITLNVREGCDSGNVFRNTIDGVNVLSVRIMATEHPGFFLPGDRYYLLSCNKDTSLPLTIRSDPLIVSELLPEPVVSFISQLTLEVVDPTTLQRISVASIKQSVLLRATMKLTNTDAGSPRAIQLHDCVVAPSEAFDKTEYIKNIDEYGCGIPTVIAFLMSTGFSSYRNHPNYDVNPDDGSVYYVAHSAIFTLGIFQNPFSRTLYFQCGVTPCYSMNDICFSTDHCRTRTGKRRKRELTNTTTTTLSTALFVTFADPTSKDDGTTDNTTSAVQLEDCFPSWIFVVVVVILVLLLVFSILISFCILYRLNRRNSEIMDEKY